MSGSSKIELILELKNKIKSGLKEAKDKIRSDVKYMKSKIGELKSFTKQTFKDISTEFPLIGKAFKLIKNPIVAAGLAIVGIGRKLNEATQKAADFNTTFRDLANLNLDKSYGEIADLKKTVLDTAYRKGFDANQTAIAFTDVQSTTGKYGAEVQKIVEKQGEFAKLMRADFNEYISSTAKAMINFGFGADKLDEFNRSAYATMNVGVATFDQLAKVQSVYAGAAKSAMQGFDAANKMFSLFTISTKSADEAATQTKSLFNDLTKNTTVKAFKKIGINVYDANGKFKQADKLLIELNNKFRGLDKDSRVVALKNQFTGSEGLIALIQAATDKTGQLQTTLSSFDSSEVGLNKALGIAKNDLNYINEQLLNKTNTSLIKLGEKMLPLKLWWTKTQINAIDTFTDMIRTPQERKQYSYQQGYTEQNAVYGNIAEEASKMDRQQFNAKQKEIFDAMNKYETAWRNAIQNIENTPLPFGAQLLWTKDMKYEYKHHEHGYSGAFYKAQYDYLKNLTTTFPGIWYDATGGGTNIQSGNTPGGKTPGGSGGNTLGDSISSVTGSARQIRNITVNIDSFNKGGINTQNTSLQKMDAKQIENWFVDACMRAVRNVELSYT
jgi:TP901 family phage tail tape measure protein